MKPKPLFFCALFILSSVSAQAALPSDPATELSPAQEALSQGDYPKAFTLYSRLADHNPLAQFSLGQFYQHGWGRPVDAVKACYYFEQAANANIPTAQHALGDCLVQGIGQPADGAAALGWYRKAAGNGSLISLCSAADLYISGNGIEKNPAQGLALCQQAAQAGSIPAMLKLADYFREGTDMPQDLPMSLRWFQAAAERGNAEAQYHLGTMLSEGTGVPADPATGLYWLETAASQGYTPAYLPTAILYANTDPDPTTGAIKPEYLAKVYLWNSAAKARVTDPAQQLEIDRIAAMVQTVMPPTWAQALDKKVAAHLASFKD